MLPRTGNAPVARPLATIQRRPATKGRPPPASSGPQLDPTAVIDQAGAVATEVETILLPAYRAAVDALDVAGALSLARAIAEGMRTVTGGMGQAAIEVEEADPYARMVSKPGDDPAKVVAEPAPIEIEVSKRSHDDQTTLVAKVGALRRLLAVQVGPQVFRGQAVAFEVQQPEVRDLDSFVISESGTVVDLIITYRQIRDLVGAGSPKTDEIKQAVDLTLKWTGRPINFLFLRTVLVEENLWDKVRDAKGSDDRTVLAGLGTVQDQSSATGVLGDVGKWDMGKVRQLLALADEGSVAEAMTAVSGMVLPHGQLDAAVASEIMEMIAGAAPNVRAGLLHQLDGAGGLDMLCEAVPWLAVKQLHDAIDDPQMKARLAPHYIDKGGGKSLSKTYEENILEDLDEGHPFRAYLWTFLKTAHGALTFGFLGVHDAAYDALQAGVISNAEYASITAKAVARSAAIGGASMLTGGAAGAWGEGVAAGLGAGETTASIIGGGVGGAAAGVGGQFTGDVFDQAAFGKQGFSSLGDYGEAAALGGVTGIVTAGVATAGAKYLPESAKTMNQVYAEQYPALDNVLTQMRGSGTRAGLTIRVSAQELIELTKTGLVGTPNLQTSLDRIGLVYDNERIDVGSEQLTKVHPQSEIEKMYGPVDPATGQVSVLNQAPTSGGFVGASGDAPPGSMPTDADVRSTFGIDTNAPFYQKYSSGEPLFEVVFRTEVELDVPLPQEQAAGVPLGSVDPVTHHQPGAGRTIGGVREGVLPRGSAIEIVEIRPVGGPQASFPPTNTPYKPYSPATPSVRHLPAPLAGATGTETSHGE